MAVTVISHNRWVLINSYFVFDARLMRCSCCAMERPACPRLKEKDCLMRVKASISSQATNQTPVLQLFSNNPPIANRMGHVPPISLSFHDGFVMPLQWQIMILEIIYLGICRKYTISVSIKTWTTSNVI